MIFSAPFADLDRYGPERRPKRCSLHALVYGPMDEHYVVNMLGSMLLDIPKRSPSQTPFRAGYQKRTYA